MILITGGTGFMGNAVLQHLVNAGYKVKALIRSGSQTPTLPKSISVNVAIADLNDTKTIESALLGVDTIIHLASIERRGSQEDLITTDVQFTRNILNSAKKSQVKRVIYSSHLGSDRASAYPVLKSKAIIEEYIRKSGLDFTILRTALVFGPHDGFTTTLAGVIQNIPIGIPLPGDGKILLQPLHINDIARCITWSLSMDDKLNRTIEIGGPEHLSLNDIVLQILKSMKSKKMIIHLNPPIMRLVAITMDYLLPNFPLSTYWLDYLATNRTCSLNSIEREFGFQPTRFSKKLDYLTAHDWKKEVRTASFRR